MAGRLYRVALLCLTMSQAVSFLSQQRASQFLIRHGRANVMFEEHKQGSLERECIEEICNREEAREIFENNQETEYFYPRYLDCLSRYQVGVPSRYHSFKSYPGNLRTCITEIPDQCSPSPCNPEGSVQCVDKVAAFTCVCKEGWTGVTCQQDIDECESGILEEKACNHSCHNVPGSYRCYCDEGFYIASNKRNCIDKNECFTHSDICGKAACINLPGTFECKCAAGYAFDPVTKDCHDIDECAANPCEYGCVNFPSSYSCFCDGRKGERLSPDGQSCQEIPICVDLQTSRKADILNMGELFAGIPVVYVRFKISANSRFTAKFDLRTYDSEGVIFYAETNGNSAWFLFAVRDGKLEVQFKNENIAKVTISGGPVINDGIWHTISVEETQSSVLVKIAQESVIKINSPNRLFSLDNETTEIKISIAGLPRQADRILPTMNPRLDGCMRRWTWMNQGSAGIEDVIRNIESKQCYQNIAKGSYFPGMGYAMLPLIYNMTEDPSKGWKIKLNLHMLPSKDTGVLFALVRGEDVPLSLALTYSNSMPIGKKQDLLLTIGNRTVSQAEGFSLCDGERHSVNLTITAEDFLWTVDEVTHKSHLSNTELKKQLFLLDQAMQETVNTTLGGLPAVPFTSTPITASFTGCLDVQINDAIIDLDEASHRDPNIQSHSCPSVKRED
ncbi:vitamin K-dependent protein S isoform X1 [Hemiscyllium ocellatum]|uniref:vitamin K-dependent protein S isoform X1 n=2 Tax=Hemiscyllium ocellatum TaxID=170820 RepID=UPI0029665A04|nr:vitamin K-dependent protein S isoform X1 [Hemiscyllium ocellatum]